MILCSSRDPTASRAASFTARMSRKPAADKKRASFPPKIKDNPKITPGTKPVAKESKKRVVYDRIVVFDFTPLASGNYIYSLSKAQTMTSGITNKELNEDIFRLSSRELKRTLNIWDPPHSHLLFAKVDSRKSKTKREMSIMCLNHVPYLCTFCFFEVCPTTD